MRERDKETKRGQKDKRLKYGLNRNRERNKKMREKPTKR